MKERQFSWRKRISKKNQNQGEDEDNSLSLPLSRRRFIGYLGVGTAAVGLVGVSSLTTGCHDSAQGQVASCEPIAPLGASQRAEAAFE